MTGEACTLADGDRRHRGRRTPRPCWTVAGCVCAATRTTTVASGAAPARSSASPAAAAAARSRSPRRSSACGRRRGHGRDRRAAARGPAACPRRSPPGVGFVPQDRHHQGFVPDCRIADNVTLTVPDRLGPARLHRRRAAATRWPARMIDEAATSRRPGPELPVSGLSGGNQQKVVMARALANDPRLLVLINPTAGVDVRSKELLLGKVEETAATRHRRAHRLRRARRPAHLRPGPGDVPGPGRRRDRPRLARPRTRGRHGRSGPRCLRRVRGTPRRGRRRRRPTRTAPVGGRIALARLRDLALDPGDHRHRDRRPDRQPGLPADRQPASTCCRPCPRSRCWCSPRRWS